MEEENIIASIDLGSSKTTVLISRINVPNEIELIGIGVSESKGIKAGGVTNIEATVNSIKEAIEEAELMSGIEISQATLNITGKHVKGDNSIGVIAITNKDRVISSQDIFRVIEAAQAIRIPADQEILHVLSKEFKVDDQAGIKDPEGMIGVRLEADVHIVTGGKTYIQNTEKSLREAGMVTQAKVLSSLASSNALLTDGEKDLGVAVVDIGAGVIDLIIYVDGGAAYSSTICIGGQHITQDISIMLKTPIDAAEILKKKFGSASPEEIDPIEMVDVPSVGERPSKSVPRRELSIIIQARIKEILELIDHELIKSGEKQKLAGGIIFTGGTALINGLIPLAEEIIELGASIGYPKGIMGISDKVASPIFSTGVGLIQYAKQYNFLSDSKKQNISILSKMKNWIQDNL